MQSYKSKKLKTALPETVKSFELNVMSKLSGLCLLIKYFFVNSV